MYRSFREQRNRWIDEFLVSTLSSPHDESSGPAELPECRSVQSVRVSGRPFGRSSCRSPGLVNERITFTDRFVSYRQAISKSGRPALSQHLARIARISGRFTIAAALVTPLPGDGICRDTQYRRFSAGIPKHHRGGEQLQPANHLPGTHSTAG